jgi:hypothetical protein
LKNYFRSSNYDRDRDRGTSDIKKRLDDFPSKRDDYKSRDNYSNKSRDDYKRDDLPRHGTGSSNYSGHSRIDSSSSLNKDRFSDRSNSDYRNNSSRNDDRDSRNGSNKPRYLDPPASETRFSDSRSNVSGTAWNSNSSHPSFNLNPSSGNVWVEKQVQETPVTGWRGLEDNRYDRFANNDRKPVALATSEFISPTVIRSTQFISGNTSNIAPNSGSRFNNRYDNGRF